MTKDEFLLFTMILRLQMGMIVNFFYVSKGKLSNSIVIKIWSLSIAKVCICCVKCSSFVHIGKMVTVGMLRSMMAHGCLNLLSYKIHLCQ